MTNEELLRPRYKVIADYPNATYDVGAILIEHEETGELYSIEHGFSPTPKIITPAIAKDMPHLFQCLNWWEERKMEDMPEYVKGFKQSIITRIDGEKVKWSFFNGDVGGIEYDRSIGGGGTLIKYLIPATLEEYNNYTKQITQ